MGAISDIRFVLKEKVIHLQIEQSPLLPDGYLNRSSSSWVPLPDLQYQSDSGSFVMMSDGQKTPLEKYHDYTFIDREQRRINIDEISAEIGHVITGVWLNHVEPSQPGQDNTSPIQLEIYALPFDAATGKLIDDGDRQKWITPVTQPYPPQEYTEPRELFKYGTIAYLFDKEPHYAMLKPNTAVEFTVSDWGVNAGQETIPFIDLRSVDNGNNLAIDGVGLFYYNAEKHVGYLSLKLLSMDLSRRLNPSMTSEQVKYYSKSYRKLLTHAIPQSEKPTE